MVWYNPTTWFGEQDSSNQEIGVMPSAPTSSFGYGGKKRKTRRS